MKKSLTSILLCVCLCGCQAVITAPKQTAQKTERTVGVWISLFEMRSVGLSKDEFSDKFDKMFQNIKSIGGTDVLCHIRPNGDAYYKSKYFPFSAGLTGTEGKDPDFDPLEILIELSHEKGLKFHAWVNPYRASSSIKDISSLAENHPARVWLTDKDKRNDGNVKIINHETTKTVYFNPARLEVQKLILDGIREIATNYDIDGIHMDDYFYPTTEPSFDKEDYDEYCRSAEPPLSLDNWRRTNIDSLISSAYRICKQNGVLFGISPSAHISTDGTDKNYTEQYADIKKWLSSAGFADYIAPQLYFGYEYPLDEFKFSNLLNQWLSMKRDKSVKLFIGLANYKIGDRDADSLEWTENDDIIARQTADCFDNGADGVFLYSYTAIFSDKEINRRETENLKKLLIK